MSDLEFNTRLKQLAAAEYELGSLYQPHIFNIVEPEHRAEIKRLLAAQKIQRVIDTYNEQVGEWQLVNNPAALLQNHAEQIIDNNEVERDAGERWVYYPWRSTLVRILGKEAYERLRLSRNQLLITPEEQSELRNLTIGVVGLNVGNPGAVCLALEGVGRQYKFADPDILSLSNLNRFRAGLTDLGLNKAVLSARQVYEIDPYVNVEILPEGVTAERLEQFLLEPKIDVLVEEMDNLQLKIHIREAARAAGIPVVMVTGNGENIIIDVERYDIDASLLILNGMLGAEVHEQIIRVPTGAMSLEYKIQLARDFMGVDVLDERLVASFAVIGRELAGIPQLAEASFLRGAALCYIIRTLFTTGALPSGRYHFRWSKVFN